jgi:hypothetical protein
MNNIVKDIENNCEDKSVEGIVEFLNQRGDIKFTADYHREIFLFYNEARKMPLTHREAKQTTIQLFGISSENFKVIMRKYKEVI